MAQYVGFEPGVEVNGETVLSIVNAFPEYLREYATQILGDNGIVDPVPGKWYLQQAWLDSFKTISEKFGSNTLFEIGKAIPANAKFPPDIDSLQKALMAIDMAYNMNHRKGKIGYYKLMEFNAENSFAIMECNNPYPCDFDRGIITTMSRRFRPENGSLPIVTLDTSKPGRKDGKDVSVYKVSW